MLFNSYPFLFVFLPICLIGYFLLSKWGFVRIAVGWLLLMSLIFYGYWNVAYVPLIAISILVNFGLGRWMGRIPPAGALAKGLLVLGLCFNLGALAYYKYANFLVSNLPLPTLTERLEDQFHLSEIVLPLAISFFTFQQLAYVVDAFRGQAKPYSLVEYALFVAFFPQLIAGPIVHHQELIEQFQKPRKFIFSHHNFALGTVFFSLGLFKKVVIADTLSPWVASPFEHASELSFIEAWAGALSYTFQLYFDFSGYSDMAIGLGRMLNIRIPLNFNSPYKAISIIDFWRRWHITLSNFLRDYLYIPLGGSRKGEVRRSVNLFLTMLLGGLWHGAGWTYVIWGGLHGLYLTINHWWRQKKIPLPRPLAWGITFLAIVVGWVLFRAKTFGDALQILHAMSGLEGIVVPGKYRSLLQGLSPLGVQFNDLPSLSHLPGGIESLLVLAGLLVWVIWAPNVQEVVQGFKFRWWTAPLMAGLAVFALLSLNRVSEFLYFQF
jgi:alginate O-acetyltransferase complex protein AlgI